jgi:hypothetical protein
MEMALIPGFIRYRGRIMNRLEAGEFRRLERRLRHYVDLRRPIEAMQVLKRIKEFAGDHEEYRRIFEDLRRDYAERWAHAFGRSWKADILAIQPG